MRERERESQAVRLGVESASAGINTIIQLKFLWANTGLYKVNLSIFAVLYLQDLRERPGLL
jgi:hypothetical protein